MENLDNKIAASLSSSGAFRNSHETLLILRRAKDKQSDRFRKQQKSGWKGTTGVIYEKIEIRHQRTEDVCFDYVRIAKEDGRKQGTTRRILPHEWVHRMAETLLPYSVPSKAPAALTKTEILKLQKEKEEEKKKDNSPKEEKDVFKGKTPEEVEEIKKKKKEEEMIALMMPKIEIHKGRGRLLELWAQPGVKRIGWTMLAQHSQE